jgi:hypothetical protein
MGVMLEKALNLIYGAISVVWVILFICWVDNVSNYVKAGYLTHNQFVCALASVLALYVASIAIHEAGHWFCGRWLGFMGTRFTVLWLNIERRGQRWVLKWAKRPAKLGGMVMQYPVGGKQLRLRKFLSVAAGPAANWVTGGVAILLSYALADPAARVSGSIRLLTVAELQVFGLVSTFMGCLNLLPRKLSSSLRNDGLLLWQLWRREPALDRQLAVSALVGSSYAGLRPREWDGTLLDRALAYSDNSVHDCSAFLLAYSHHLDANRPEKGRSLLYACLDKLDLLPPESQQQVCCEAAYFEAWYAQDVAQARHWLARAQQIKEFAGGEGHFVQAAVAWAGGHYEAAQLHLQRAEAEPPVQNENDAGGHLQALDRLLDFRTRLSAGPTTSM